MKRPHLFLRRPGFEALESRELMAGDVFVNVSEGGDLIVRGDFAENEIQIVQPLQENGAPVAGRYHITGLNGTRINGVFKQAFSNVTHDLQINLSGGNDRLTLGNGVNNAKFIVPNDLKIEMGGGADVVVVDKITVRDDVSIATGDGNDSVTFRGSVGNLPGFDGGENDLFIDTGERADNVLLQNTFVRRNLVVNAGSDNFSDVVDLRFMNVGRNTNIATGEGNDIVRISDAGFNDDLTILTGTGNDSVSIVRTQVDELFVSLGAGQDQISLRDSSGRRARIDSGADVDFLTRTNSPFSESFEFI